MKYLHTTTPLKGTVDLQSIPLMTVHQMETYHYSNYLSLKLEQV
jgi:hypothetical protein